MHTNNFDTSSTGTNIELSCFYDSDIARHYFEDNFTCIRRESYREVGLWYYTDWGNVTDHEIITFELHGKVEEMRRFLRDDDCYFTKPLRKREDFIEAIENYVYQTIDLTNYEEVNKQYFDKYKLEYKPSKELEKVAVRGYSQGDYAEVLYCPVDLEKARGKEPNEDELLKTFRQYFYDAPIYCSFTINDKSYDYADFVEDDYEWEPEAFAQAVSEESGVPYETLFDMLPEYPSYN